MLCSGPPKHDPVSEGVPRSPDSVLRGHLESEPAIEGDVFGSLCCEGDDRIRLEVCYAFELFAEKLRADSGTPERFPDNHVVEKPVGIVAYGFIALHVNRVGHLDEAA